MQYLCDVVDYVVFPCFSCSTVPHKAVADVSKMGNLQEELNCWVARAAEQAADGATGGWSVGCWSACSFSPDAWLLDLWTGLTGCSNACSLHRMQSYWLHTAWLTGRSALLLVSLYCLFADLSIYLSTYLSTYLPIYLSIHPSIHLSIYLSVLPIYPVNLPSRSLMFSHLLLSKFLLWKHPSACCWSYSKLRKTLPFHMSMQPVCLPSHDSFSLMWNLLQNAQSITFSQVNATCVSPVQFYYILYAYQNAEHIVFPKVRVTCVSRPFFSYPLIRNLFQNAADVVFLQVNAACVAFLVFLYSLLHGGVVESPVFFQFPVSRVVERPVFFQFHLSVPVPFQFLLWTSCVFLGFVLQSFYFGNKVTSVSFAKRRVATQTLEKHRKSAKGTGQGIGREVTHGIGKTRDIPSPWANGTGKMEDFSCFCYEGRKKLDGRHTGCIKCDKVMFCALGHRSRFHLKS